MAFKVNETEAVAFGELNATPQLNAELELRITNLSFSSADEVEHAQEVLASAFPKEKNEVLSYLRTGRVSIFELMRLQAYLQGGESAVAAYDASFSKAVERALDKTVTDNA